MRAIITNKIKNIAKADIVKVFSLTAVSTLVKMLTGFVSVKIIAILLGPQGIALMGQLSNFATIIMSVGAVGINNGITKYVAEFKEDNYILKQFLSTAYRITVAGSLVCALFLIFFSSFLSELLLKTSEYSYVFIIFGFTIIFYTINNLLISVVNGFKEFKMFVKINIANSIFGLLYTVIFVYFFGLPGAFISFVTYQSVSLIITIYMLRKYEWFRWDYFKDKFSSKTAKRYLHYSLMTLVSIAVIPTSQIVMRTYVIDNISEIAAGWWEAMNRLSAMYLMVITSSFGVYYLPRLSELQGKYELKQEIIKAYKVIIPMILSGFTLIYFLRFFIIKILFTSEFEPMENLFIWQLTGDFFKITSWLLAFLMLAKSRTLAFISTEVISTLLYLGLALYIVNYSGVVGLVQAYCINYFIYLITMIILFKDILFAKKSF